MLSASGGKVARVRRYLYMCPLDYAKWACTSTIVLGCKIPHELDALKWKATRRRSFQHPDGRWMIDYGRNDRNILRYHPAFASKDRGTSVRSFCVSYSFLRVFFVCFVPSKRQSYLCNRPWMPTGRDIETPTFSRQSAHRWRWCCQPHAPAAVYLQEDSWYSFLLEAESTPGP
jgi:hypothetical protein